MAVAACGASRGGGATPTPPGSSDVVPAPASAQNSTAKLGPDSNHHDAVFCRDLSSALNQFSNLGSSTSSEQLQSALGPIRVLSQKILREAPGQIHRDVQLLVEAEDRLFNDVSASPPNTHDIQSVVGNPVYSGAADHVQTYAKSACGYSPSSGS
jgi:hypothetical protein